MKDCTLCFENKKATDLRPGARGGVLCTQGPDNLQYINYCHFAAINDHIDCLKYAHQEGCDLDINVCLISIYKGSLKCLEYAHKNGGEMCVNSCELAARYGKLECMKYIYDNGGSIDNSCYWAARYGHLDCLKFAHENGGFKDLKKISAVYKIALKKKHYSCFQYAFNYFGTDTARVEARKNQSLVSKTRSSSKTSNKKFTGDDTKIFECKICNKKFPWKINLKQHNKTTATVSPQYLHLPLSAAARMVLNNQNPNNEPNVIIISPPASPIPFMSPPASPIPFMSPPASPIPFMSPPISPIPFM